MTVPLRAALYLRVSTARQAEHDVSTPDQKRQGEAYCAARGCQLVETYVEPGASAANDRRPEFQRMIEAGTSKPAPFDIVIVHSFSRFFRDHFELEFYVRRLAKNGVRLVSIDREVRIIGSKSNLLQTLTAASNGTASAVAGDSCAAGACAASRAASDHLTSMRLPAAVSAGAISPLRQRRYSTAPSSRSLVIQ